MQYSTQLLGGIPFRPLGVGVGGPPRWAPASSAYQPMTSPELRPQEAPTSSRPFLTGPEDGDPGFPAASSTDRLFRRPIDSQLDSSKNKKAEAECSSSNAGDAVVAVDMAFDDDEEEVDLSKKKNPSLGPEGEGEERFAVLFKMKANSDGLMAVSDLPTVLEEAGVHKAPALVHAAIHTLLGLSTTDHDNIVFDRAVLVYHALLAGEEFFEEEYHGGVLARWVDQASDSHASTVLLAIVVVLSVMSATLAAGLSIVFMLGNMEAMQYTQMVEDIGIMQDIVNVFDQNLFVSEVNTRVAQLATIIASVTQDVSYQSVLDYEKKNLQYVAQFMAGTVSAWWGYLPETSFTNIARVQALWLDASVNRSGRPFTFTLIDNMLNTLPPGYEILVGQWTNASNKSVEFLTRYRYADQCVGVCGTDTSVEKVSPMKIAMQGIDGAMETYDYRPHLVLVGYSSIDGMGIEWKEDIEMVDQGKYNSIAQFFNAQNANATGTRQFLLGQIDNVTGAYNLLTTVENCDAECVTFLTQPAGPLGLALQGGSGIVQTIGYGGQALMSAYMPINGTGMALVVQEELQTSIDGILSDAARIVDYINANVLTGTDELELSVGVENGTTTTFRHLSAFKYAGECGAGGCLNATPYLLASAENCSSGVMRTTDYRGQPVAVGYYCMAGLNAYLSMKVDNTDLETQMLSYIVQFFNLRNQKDMGTSDEFLAATYKPGITAATMTNYSDYQLLTKVKYPSTCLDANCTWQSHTLLRALQHKPGDLPATMTGVNYAGIPVTAAVEYDAIAGGIGMVLEQSTADYMAPLINTAIWIVVFTAATVTSLLAILVLVAKWMMRGMIQASEEGKKAVEKEKLQFQALVTSMYPAYVVPRLLAGDQHIVSHVKHSAVFFSDIYEFTSASNVITSQELIQFMGYTYGVMDEVADRCGVYKVKTIGDAYLAVTGLPGSETKDCCLDLLRFASFVCQIFSHRFNHPEKGNILAQVGGVMSWNRIGRRAKRAGDKASESSSDKKKGYLKPSAAAALTPEAYGTQAGQSEVESNAVSSANTSNNTGNVGGVPQVQCVMSYGLATGPIIAGVLHGKSPAFDIWGKTVNLASRMQSTGQPGRIQISEQLFRKVAAIPGQPFTFEPGHKAYCKGFGAVNSFFLRSATEPPPKDLMLMLGLEPRFGLFYFDNVLNGVNRNVQRSATSGPVAKVAGGPASKTLSRSSEDGRSEDSSGASQLPVSNPHVAAAVVQDLAIEDAGDDEEEEE